MIDAVLSYHTNPLTCGVAKFNHALARRLGVPCLGMDYQNFEYRHPLISLKLSEVTGRASLRFNAKTYTLLLHDRQLQSPNTLMDDADQVFYADELGCPSTVHGDATRGTIDVLCFGMAHKFQQPHFERLKTLLDRMHGESYTVSLSTGIHEGNPWDVSFTENMALMRDIFGDHLRCLGFLADDGLARILKQVTHVALFFHPAVRANNTTLWAALDAAVPVITNLDADSPKELQHNRSVYDLAQLTEFPLEAARHREVRAGGAKASAVYSWDRLIEALQGVRV